MLLTQLTNCFFALATFALLFALADFAFALYGNLGTMGFAIALLKSPFKFPKSLYQSLTIYLLVAIGWQGGELMAVLPSSELAVAGGLAAVGFIVFGRIGLIATWLLRIFTPMLQTDAVTVSSYFESASSGTLVTWRGIPATRELLHESFLLGLFLTSRLSTKVVRRITALLDKAFNDLVFDKVQSFGVC